MADPATYRVIGGRLVVSTEAAWVSRPNQRIRYRAGYGKTVVENGTEKLVNDPPANAKAAIILMTVELLAQARADGGLRSFQVDGAFSEAYNNPDIVQKARSQAVENLLAPLRVFA